MTKNRSTDKESKVAHFRTADRIMNINGAWWFAAREGDMGPYDTRQDAEKAAAQFIESQILANKLLSSRDENGKLKTQSTGAEKKLKLELAPVGVDDKGVWKGSFHA